MLLVSQRFFSVPGMVAIHSAASTLLSDKIERFEGTPPILMQITQRALDAVLL